MDKPKVFQRENQRIPASEILQALANGDEIRLYRCSVSGELNVNRLFKDEENFDTSNLAGQITDDQKIIILYGSISFKSCTFEDNVCFSPPWDQANRLAVVFKNDVFFNSSVFLGQCRFSEASFCGTVRFDGCGFERIAVFRNTSFQNEAMYRTASFNGYAMFNGAVFHKEASFTNTCFGKGGNFTKVKFCGKTDFVGVYARSRSVPVHESVCFARHKYGDDENFWRFVKQACQEAGYYRMAGESFYKERCAYLWRKFLGADYEDLSCRRKIGRIAGGLRLVPELVFGRLLFGYGERPVRILAAGAIIIVICALFYASPWSVIAYRFESGLNQQSFMEGLYFSTITFTTLGFGDIYPGSGHMLTRCVAMFEAISGAVLTALFVVSLAKRYSRG